MNIVCACIAAPVALAIIIYTIRAVVKDEREASKKGTRNDNKQTNS